MRIEPEKSEVQIVLNGSFNPAIFSPAWFSKVGLFTDKECASAKIQISVPQVSIFSMDWLNVQVQTMQFVATTTEAPFVRLCDLVTAVFEFLQYTPIREFGINRIVEFEVESEEIRNSIGRKLAPIEPWGEWAKEIANDDGEPRKRGGLKYLSMEQKNLHDRLDGHVQATISPANGDSRIAMATNDHFVISKDAEVVGCREAMECLNKSFERSLQHSEFIIDQIMALGDVK